MISLRALELYLESKMAFMKDVHSEELELFLSRHGVFQE